MSELPNFVTNPDPEIYLNGSYVVVDFEISGGKEYGHSRDPANGLLLACWIFVEAGTDKGSHESSTALLSRGDRAFGGKVQVHWGSEFDLGALRRDIERADFVIAHNAKFELGWLARAGINLRRVLPYCTMLGEYVLAGNERKPLGLDATASRYGLGAKQSFSKQSISAGVDPVDVPRSLLETYCIWDVLLTHEIFKIQRRKIFDLDLQRVLYCRNLVTPALADIESRGMTLDPARVKETYEVANAEFIEASKTLDAITGGINFRSPKQMAGYLYETLGFDELTDRKGNPARTGSNKKKTDMKTVALLSAKNQKQKDFKKALATLAPMKKKVQILENMIACCAEDGGRVYASINQGVTGTHRLASSGGKWGFQFHNFPRAFKSLFRAREEGWYICEGDAPQLEFRVAADLGNDATAKEDILQGVDVHQFSASILGVSRQDAKAHTFKPLYGGQSGTPREREYYSAFRERYAGIYATQQRWVYEVLRSKALVTATGLRFYWGDTEVTKSGWVSNTPSIFNYPIQMFATADIIPLTLALIWYKLADKETYIVNTIHDSVVAEVPEGEVEEVKRLYRWAFTDGVTDILRSLYDYEFTTPLGVGLKVGIHWAEGTEEKYG